MTKKKELLIIDDTYSESLTYKSQCMRCKHEFLEGKCKAFPDGIPMDIWSAKKKCKHFQKMN